MAAKTSVPKLTQLAQCAGCAAKLRPGQLSQVLAGLGGLKAASRKNVLVGFETSDDAAVYKLDANTAIVETVDFFPPVVDDPYTYGQIAAANAMSDIWAMGGKALFALNIVGFPKELPLEVLGQILKGGHDKAHEAGIPILGGHSIQDAEPKYGMAVTGVIHPKKVLTNSRAKDGDVLFLTKPLGIGIATTAMKRGVASKALQKNAIGIMTTLNKAAGEVFASGKFKVNALTDVTGFGLLGHLWEMMSAAQTRAKLFLERLPIIAEVPELASKEVVPGGTKSNLDWVSPHVVFPEGLPIDIQWVLADAQTNGGLLASVPWKDAEKVLKALNRNGVGAAPIGEVVSGEPGIDVIG